MQGIDAATQRVLQDSADRVNTLAPHRTWPKPRIDADAVAETDLKTTNPPATAMTFEARTPSEDPSREASEISARLERYQGLGAAAPPPEEPMILDLPEVFRLSHKTAREFLSAEEEYILAAINLLIERHLWGPRLFNDTTVAFEGDQGDGNVSHILNIINELRATQRLPYGGQVEAKWLWEATENLRSAATGQYVQSSELSLDASIPLLRGAGIAAREDRIQAERGIIYAARDFEAFRREFLVDLARDYFGLLQQRASIRNQACQLESLLEVERRQEAWYDAGRIPEYDLNNARNNVRRAQANLANLKENFALSLDRFKLRLGIPVERPVQIRQVLLNLPEPQITPEQATQAALAYRLDLQNARDFLDDSRRGVLVARNDLLPDLTVGAGVRLPTDPDEREGGVAYQPNDVKYDASVTFGLPLDRKIERLNVRRSVIELAQSERGYEQFRDELVLDVRASVREIDRARFNLLLAEEQVRLTMRRQREQEIKVDEITTQEQLDALDELLEAENARDQARTDLRNAVLEYLLATGQMRVGNDGAFQPLPGMPEDPVVVDMEDDMSFDCNRPEPADIGEEPLPGEPAEGADAPDAEEAQPPDQAPADRAPPEALPAAPPE